MQTKISEVQIAFQCAKMFPKREREKEYGKSGIVYRQPLRAGSGDTARGYLSTYGRWHHLQLISRPTDWTHVRTAKRRSKSLDTSRVPT